MNKYNWCHVLVVRVTQVVAVELCSQQNSISAVTLGTSPAA